MKKEAVIVGFVLCVLGGFVAGFLVNWPSGPASSGNSSGALQHPTKGPADALIKIVEFSDFQ